MDNRQHGERAYNLLKDNVPAKYKLLSGTHYNIYDKGRMKAIRIDIDWFDMYLANPHY
ncbi:MAG TPA: hypothetical protein VMX36_14310 [Sedimentisphaerales bacterium]|nr:hypothetical protein [Sedimentisphaerales bacterium]